MQPVLVVAVGPGEDRSAGGGTVGESVVVHEFTFE